MNSFASIFSALILMGLWASAGCALVPIPTKRTLPNPIREIDVVQADTGQAISNAEVVLYADRFTNWMDSFPPECNVVFIPPDEHSIVISLHQEASAQFMPERRSVWRKVRPWGVGPLGTCIYEDYEVTVSARAEGFMPVTATYWPQGDMNRMVGSPRQVVSDFQLPKFTTNGTLVVYLFRTNAAPAFRQAEASQPTPKQIKHHRRVALVIDPQFSLSDN